MSERTDRFRLLMACLSLTLVAVAIGLEGAVVPAYGGPVVVGAILLGLAWIGRMGIGAPERLTRLGLGLLGLSVAWAFLPIPPAIRGLVAPGQMAWMHTVSPEHQGDLLVYLEVLARYDLDATMGTASAWTTDLLAGAVDTVARPGAVDREAAAWAVARWIAWGMLFVVGRGLGRSRTATLVVVIGVLGLGIGESVFGLINRDGPSTGLGPKTAYLGSATGTFVNRGHFAAFLALCIGCAWGLMGALFPLESSSVRQHRARRHRSSHPPSLIESSGDKLPRLVFLSFLASILGIGLIAAQSRGPMVCMAVMGLVVALWVRYRREEPHHIGIALILPIAGSLLAALTLGVRGAFGRFRALLSGDVSVTSRIDVWRAGIDAWWDAPIFGHGPGGWRLAYPLHEAGAHLYDFTHAHNGLVEQLVEVGLVGLVGLGLLVVSTFQKVRVELDRAPQELRTGLGVGLLIGVGAILLQSLGDFPLHTPGVAVPFFLLAGMALGCLEASAPASIGWLRAPWGLAGVAGIVLVVPVIQADRADPGTRAERLSEHPALLRASGWSSTDRAEVEAWLATAHAQSRLHPLDPWVHLAVGRGEARLGVAAKKIGGPRPAGDLPAERTFAAEKAVQRALHLRPRDPRVLVSSAGVLITLMDAGRTRHAFDVRATALLADAIHKDFWRAEEAFKLAAALPLSSLKIMVDAAAADGKSQSRVGYQYGKALERRGLKTEARLAYEQAAGADETFGPPFFSAATLYQAEGNTQAAAEWFTSFLSARERPLAMEGWAHFYLGDLATAEVRFRRAVAEGGGSTWAWEGLARIAADRGDRVAERTALTRILAINPSHRWAQERLDALQ